MMNNPIISIIGETFFLSNHIQISVIINPASPGIKSSKLFCNVVILIGLKDKPAACCTNACLIPSAPLG